MNKTDRIWELLATGKWYRLSEISEYSDTPESSASALVRNFRKQIHGAFTIDRRYDTIDRVYEYRLKVR